LSIRDILKRIIFIFFLIWGLTWIVLLIVGLAYGWNRLYFDVLIAVFAISALCSLTYFVFYSKKELKGVQVVIRIIIQFVLVLVISISILYFMDILAGPHLISLTTLIMVLTVIFTLVSSYEWFMFIRHADKINEKLRNKFKK